MFVTIMLWCSIIFAASCNGEDLKEAGCIAAAQNWVQQIDQISRPEVLLRNTRSDCNRSLKWMKKNTGNTSVRIWEQTCTDLILVWTHKKCIYYRDDIDHRAYYPCKEWTRQMYDHCIRRDITWFSEQ